MKNSSKLLFGLNGKVEVYKLANKKDNTPGKKQYPGQGYTTTYAQVRLTLNIFNVKYDEIFNIKGVQED